MRNAHTSKSKKLSNSPAQLLTLVNDERPMVKIALSARKSKAFCSKIITLTKSRSKRHLRIKAQVKDEIEMLGLRDVADDLLARKVYLHPAAHSVIGKHLMQTAEMRTDVRRKVK